MPKLNNQLSRNGRITTGRQLSQCTPNCNKEGFTLDTAQDFLIKLGIKPRMPLMGNKHFITK